MLEIHQTQFMVEYAHLSIYLQLMLNQRLEYLHQLLTILAQEIQQLWLYKEILLP
jgi:hypothetical protein